MTTKTSSIHPSSSRAPVQDHMAWLIKSMKYLMPMRNALGKPCGPDRRLIGAIERYVLRLLHIVSKHRDAPTKRRLAKVSEMEALHYSEEHKPLWAKLPEVSRCVDAVFQGVSNMEISSALERLIEEIPGMMERLEKDYQRDLKVGCFTGFQVSPSHIEK